jgi:uncharacterized protein (DUF58 family)
VIPPHVLRELRYLEISTARAIRTARLGPYTSRARGPGFDFHEHLHYRPGDDVRRIDWNVTARLNAPYFRQTHAERELDLVMAVDVSRSMEIGSGDYPKKEVTTFVTASLLFSAAADQINAGLLAFSDRVLRWESPRRASGRAWRMLEEMWAIMPGPSTTCMLPAVRHLVATLRTMSIVTIVSDFVLADDVFSSPELRVLAARHDVIAVVVEDSADASLPSGRGFMRVRDVETGARAVVALNQRTRAEFSAASARRRRTIVDACHRMGIQPVFVRSDRLVLQPLIELFAGRKRA